MDLLLQCKGPPLPPPISHAVLSANCISPESFSVTPESALLAPLACGKPRVMNAHLSSYLERAWRRTSRYIFAAVQSPLGRVGTHSRVSYGYYMGLLGVINRCFDCKMTRVKSANPASVAGVEPACVGVEEADLRLAEPRGARAGHLAGGQRVVAVQHQREHALRVEPVAAAEEEGERKYDEYGVLWMRCVVCWCERARARARAALEESGAHACSRVCASVARALVSSSYTHVHEVRMITRGRGRSTHKTNT
jgi:hypothetical protein